MRGTELELTRRGCCDRNHRACTRRSHGGQQMSVTYPPAAFHFRVAFDRSPRGEHDWEFQEVTGIGTEMELETVREGGENRYVLQLPKGAKSTRLIMKRGVAPLSSPLTQWCRQVLE